ncbi:hypothetical protein IC620_09485 [Hazenella sp. IB182357]|uniref:Uncharacterized protein n=1 Tax=Polycladospora coralii TaxID=2771432 RepID=A0A926RTA7_9BACL|nr:GPW/gp25 family protein [Polycladospora coralii]MBD1372585.1 hypothetical protein [Polycladospora coralii]
MIEHIVRQGDTLPQLAQYYLGEASRWTEIVEANQLLYPYLVPEQRTAELHPDVRAVGESIRIATEPPYQRVEDERFLGEDLSLGWQGELGADAYGDLACVSGLENLQQAIRMRLSTPEGALLHHPTYGSRIEQLLGTKGDENTLRKLKIELERCVRSEPRVEEVRVSEVVQVDECEATLHIRPLGFTENFKMDIQLNEQGVKI